MLSILLGHLRLLWGGHRARKVRNTILVVRFGGRFFENVLGGEGLVRTYGVGCHGTGVSITTQSNGLRLQMIRRM